MLDKINIHKAKIGGTRDTLALSAIGTGALVTSPMFESLPFLTATALAAIGSVYLGGRFLEPWLQKNVLSSQINIESAKGLTERSGLLIGYRTDTGEPVYLPDEDLMRHGLIGGQSGVGKTVLGRLFIWQQMQRGGGLAFVDGKMNGDDIQTMYHLAVLSGRAQDLLIFNPGNPSQSNTYNPILRGDPDEVAARILSLIPSTANSPGADHYKQSANQGITTIVAALQAAGLAYNFIDFVILLINQKAIEELEIRLKREKPDDPATKNLSLFLEQYKGGNKPGMENMIDIKRMKETFGGIGGRMYQFGTGKFGEVLNTYTPEIDLYDAIRSNKIIYVALPTMGKNEAASNMGKMFLGDLRTAISWVQALPDSQKPNPPFLVFMDELGSYAVDSLARPFEQSRSAKIALFPAFQTLANLESVSPDFAQMVLGNTWTKIFFKLGTQETADPVAELIGTQIGVAKTITRNNSQSSNSPILTVSPEGGAGDGMGFGETEKAEEQNRVTSGDLKELDKGECIVLYGGSKVFNVRVPLIAVDGDTAKQIGPIKINRNRKPEVMGADFFKNADRYLGGTSLQKNGRKRDASDLSDE